MADLIQPFRAALRRLVRSGEIVLVGVSGGADSLALLDLVARARRSARIEPVVVHLDHGWRAESAEDATFVARAAEERGLACVIERAEGLERSEAAAREARLRLFARAATVRGAVGVLLAHSADDQAETVLLHLLRGSGTAGLAGMRADTAVCVERGALRLLRPLLGVSRAELRGYCQAHGLTPREDPSNADPAFLRNRVRHELMPLLVELQPRAVVALARLAEVAADEGELIAEVVDAAWQSIVVTAEGIPGPGRLVLDRGLFRGLGPALQRALLRQVAARLLGPANEVTLERIEAARMALAGGRGGSVIEWPGPLRLRIDRARGTFEREA
jgi:tRNA(Ile)-lysidine synthetase-like protein